jgi:hypothetical protein
MTDCKRCGQCCLNCRYLIRLPDNTTLCRIYARRLGASCGNGNFCNLRENVPVNYPGCPYNKPEWRDENGIN